MQDRCRIPAEAERDGDVDVASDLVSDGKQMGLVSAASGDALGLMANPYDIGTTKSGAVAQSVEHWTENPGVAGSITARSTTLRAKAKGGEVRGEVRGER